MTGDLCSITDFDGNTTNYAYNSAGDLTSITPPTQSGGTQLGTTTFGYNPLGQVTSRKDGNGNTTSYQWNGEGQVTKVSYQDGTSVSLGYDKDGNLLSETASGGNSSFTYSPAGYMKTSDINGDNTTYYYDPVGNVITVAGPLGTTNYHYSTVNMLSSVSDPWGNTTVFTPTANNDQLVGSVSIPGGTTETYGYDKANRVTSYQVTNPSSTLISDSYSYFTSGGADANLMQSSTNVLALQTTSYSYDPLERLIAATGGPINYSYTYNGDGDLTSQDIGGTTTYYIPNANHENTGDTYDASGNITAYPALGSLTYNTGDQTSSITPNGGSKEPISYLSDGQTLPAGFGSTNLSYNALGSDGLSGSNTSQILRTPGGQLIAEYTGSHPYYYLLDAGGSVAGLVNSTGTLEDSYTYSPYGAQTAAANNVYNPFAYNSGLTIPGTKLIRFGDDRRAIHPAALQKGPIWGVYSPGQRRAVEFDSGMRRRVRRNSRLRNLGSRERARVLLPRRCNAPRGLGCVLSMGEHGGDYEAMGSARCLAMRQVPLMLLPRCSRHGERARKDWSGCGVPS